MAQFSVKPRQKKAIAALLHHGELTRAAAEIGVKPATILEWTTHPEFVTALNQAELGAVNDVNRGLLGLSRAAIQAMKLMLADPATPAELRLKVADKALGYLLRVRELAELELRIESLERAMHEQQN